MEHARYPQTSQLRALPFPSSLLPQPHFSLTALAAISSDVIITVIIALIPHDLPPD